MQRAVHLEVGHGHDDGVNEVGAVRETAERLEQATRQGGIDEPAVASAARDHDPSESGAPSRVADGRVKSRTEDVQVHHVKSVNQVRETEQRRDPAHCECKLSKERR